MALVALIPDVCHTCGMTTTIKMDEASRVVIPRDVRRAAGIPSGQRLKISATPGRIIMEIEPNSGKIVKLGKLKVWTGKVPSTPLEEAVDMVRHYER